MEMEMEVTKRTLIARLLLTISKTVDNSISSIKLMHTILYYTAVHNKW